MKISTVIIFSIILFISCNSHSEKEISKPNIIYIMADDLGYGELGVYGQEIIETPHLDALARSGKRFTQHYSGAPVCAPARCVLMTGMHSGHAHVRGNDEWAARGKVWDFHEMFKNPKLEGQRPLPDSVVTVAEALQEGGYTTGIGGKWGLGAPETEGIPNKAGFDFFIGYNCQRQAHTYYPSHLWKNNERIMLRNKIIPPHQGFPEGADVADSQIYEEYNQNDYAPDVIQRETLQFIKDNKEGPFFYYYASVLPHLALQAPKKWVDYYRGKIGQEEPYTGKSYFPCEFPKATYAAMISALDEHVGEIVSLLKELDIYDNTLIIFTSDNGPTYTGGADTKFFDSARPFKTDKGWGKGSVHEGGIRVPMIASWPGHIEAGTESDHISAFQDVFPTLCEVAEVEIPDGLDGISFLPALIGEKQTKHDFLYWEFPAYGGQQAVRMGAWKAIRENLQKDTIKTQLFNLNDDPREQNDVADSYSEVVQKIEDLMATEHTLSVFDRFRIKAIDGENYEPDN